MSTVTSLGFSIYSRYNGSGTREARKDLDNFKTSTMNASRKIGMLASVAPVGVAAVASLAAAAGAGAAAFASAGAAAGAYGLALKPQFKAITEATEKYSAAQDAQQKADVAVARAKALASKGGKQYEEALRKAKTATDAARVSQSLYKDDMAAMPPATRQTADALQQLKDATKNWSDSLAPKTMPAFTKALNVMRTVLPKLTPLALVGASAFGDFIDRISKAASSPEFQKFIDELTESAKIVLPAFLTAIGDVGAGFKNLIEAFMPHSATFAQGLGDMAAKFLEWTAGLKTSEGFKTFIDFVTENGPILLGILGDLASVLGSSTEAIAPMAGASAMLAEAFTGIIAMIPTDALAIFYKVALGVCVVMQLYAFWTAAAAGATTTLGIAQWWLNDACVGTRIGLAALWIQQKAIAVWAAITTGATYAWAVAQRALNYAFKTNPIIGIIAIIILLGIAVVVAYKKSDTFKKIVQAAWKGIQDGAKWCWEYLKIAFAGFMTGMRAVGAAAVWLYQNAILPAWDGIKAAANAVFNYFLKPIFTAVVASMTAMGTAAMWVYKTFIHPAWTLIMFIVKIGWWMIRATVALIVAAIKGLGWIMQWLYNNIVKPVWSAIVEIIKWVVAAVMGQINLWITVLKVIGGWFVWLWNRSKEVWGYIVTGFRWLVAAVKAEANKWINIFKSIGRGIVQLWNSYGKPVIDAFKRGLSALGSAFSSAYNSKIKPIMNAIGRVVSSIWKTVISKTFSAIKTGVSAVKSAFETAKNGIKKAWDLLKTITKAPVKFFVNTVYNDGLRAAWNATAGKIPGVPKMEKASLPKGFAKGGYLGQGTKGPNDKVPIMAQAGEYVIRAKRVREIGKSALDWLNNGSGDQARNTTDGLPGYSIGGWVGDTVGSLTDAAKGGFDWASGILKSGASKALSALFKPVRGLVNGIVDSYPGGGVVGTFIKKFANAGFDKMVDFVKGKATDDDGGNGKGGVSAARGLKWARTQAGKKYQWGGNGNPSWDCSGFTSAIESVIRGQKPHRRYSTHAFSGNTAPSGWERNRRSAYTVGITNAGVGHTAGTLSGVNVESRGGDGVLVGKKARGANSMLFRDVYGYKPLAYSAGGMIPTQRMDSGGTLPRGLSLVNNTTGAPETLSRQRDGSGEVHYHYHLEGAVIGSAKQFEDMVVQANREIKRKGRNL